MNLRSEHYDHRRKRARGQPPTNTAKPPRTRDGQAFAGGRALRRAARNLEARRKNMPNGAGYTMPGSMQG